MAITAEARTDIIALVVGMFDAAPGATFLSQFVNAVDAGSTIDTLAADLTGTGAFKGIYPDLQTSNEFATKFVDNIAPEAGTAAKAWAVTWIEAQLNGGATKAEVIAASITALRATDEADANWGNAAAALNNKVEVAEWYSVDQLGNATDLATLQNQISTVTSDDTTVTDITSGSAQSGDTFTLTTGVDAVVGTAGNDTILGNSNADGNTTLTALDSIDGGDGVDTLSVTDVNAAFNVAATADVSNVETAEFRVGGTFGATNGDVSGWTGLTSVSVDAAGDTVLEVANTTAATVDASDAAGDVTVTGGSTVTVTNDTGAGSDIAVVTGTATTSVTTTGGEDVTIGDGAALAGTFADDGETDTITSVSASGASTTVNVNSDVLATLSLTDSDADATVTAAAGTRALTVNLNNVDNGATVEDTEATSVTVNTTGAASGDTANIVIDVDTATSVAINADEALDADLEIDAAESLTISGDSAVNVTGGTFTALATVTVSGSAGVTANLATGPVATFNASATSGNNTVTLDGTESEIAVTGGTGADDVTIAGALDADGVVNLGEGDDTYTFTTAAAAGASVDAGAGNDTIAIDDGANLDANASTVYSNFETLEIAGGTGTYDMSELTGLTAVTLSGALTTAAATTAITEAVAGTTIGMTVSAAGTDETLTGTSGGAGDAEALSFALADATGDSDSLAVTLTAVDGDDDGNAAEGQVTAGLTANDIESISIASTVSALDEDDADTDADESTTADEYTNTFTLDADSVETLTLTGDAQVDVTTSAATVALTQIDATGNTAGVTVDVAAGPTGAVTFNGSAADDTVTTSGAGDLVQGNAGADSVTITAGASTVVRYAATSDSQLTLTDTSDPADGVADTATGYDDITGFVSGTDLIELSSALGLATGDARADILQKGAMAGGTAANIEAFIGDGADFFSTGLVDRAVAVSDDGAGNSFVFIDANSDGNFTQADDMVIELTGTGALTVADFTFG